MQAAMRRPKFSIYFYIYHHTTAQKLRMYHSIAALANSYCYLQMLGSVKRLGPLETSASQYSTSLCVNALMMTSPRGPSCTVFTLNALYRHHRNDFILINFFCLVYCKCARYNARIAILLLLHQC